MTPANSYVTHDLASRLQLYVWPSPSGHVWTWQYGDGFSPCGGSFEGDHCATVEHAISELRRLRRESAAMTARWRATQEATK